MSRAQDKVRESLAVIDTIKTIIEERTAGKSLGKLNYNFNFPGSRKSFNASISINPLDYLLALLQKFMPYDEIVKWLSKFIVYELPAIELGVKGVLLAALKENIDCTNDPKIPEWMRMELNPLSPQQSFIERPFADYFDRGIHIATSEIDFNGMLNISPLSKIGNSLYFGTKKVYKLKKGGTYTKDNELDKIGVDAFYSYAEAVDYAQKYNRNIYTDIVDESQVDTVWEMARAEDMNAFLWFVSHKAKFISPIQFTASEGKLKDYSDGTYSGAEMFADTFDYDSVLSVFSGKQKLVTSRKDYGKFIIPGRTIIQNLDTGNGVVNGTTLSLCIKAREEKLLDENGDDVAFPSNVAETATQSVIGAGGPIDYTFDMVPVSCNYRSANWYVDRKTYFDFLKPKKNRKARDYSREFALFNLRYLGNEGAEFCDTTGGDFLFQIMPRPFWHMPQLQIPKIANATSQILNSEKDTINYQREVNINILPIRILFDKYGNPDRKGKYTVKVNPTPRPNPEIAGTYEYDVLSVDGSVIVNTLCVYPEDRSYFLKDEDSYHLSVSLHECYPGITVYEFNYDFVMGTKLYDAETVASALLLTLANLKTTVSFNGWGKYETPYQMRIANIIQKMIDQQTGEAVDCFFNFSNEEYDRMLRESELRRANLYPFQDSQNKATAVSADDILNALRQYDDNAEGDGNVDVLTRAISQASASVTAEVLPTDKYNVRVGFVFDLIRAIVTILIETLFTPKLMLLIVVNKKLMEGDGSELSFEDIMKSVLNIVMKTIKEIINMVLQIILEEVIKQLSKLLVQIADAILAEQLEVYLSTLRKILERCAFMFNFKKTPNLATSLDEVYYADIDPKDVAEGNVNITENDIDWGVDNKEC